MSTSAVTNTETPAKTPEQLRSEMRQIRRELGNDVEVLMEQAERLMDWRYYAHQYPWALMGIAAFAGYYLMPGRKGGPSSTEQALHKLVEKLPLASAAAHPAPRPKRTTLLGSLINMGTNMAIKAATSYATAQASKIFGQQMASAQESGETRSYEPRQGTR